MLYAVIQAMRHKHHSFWQTISGHLVEMPSTSSLNSDMAISQYSLNMIVDYAQMNTSSDSTAS